MPAWLYKAATPSSNLQALNWLNSTLLQPSDRKKSRKIRIRTKLIEAGSGSGHHLKIAIAGFQLFYATLWWKTTPSRMTAMQGQTPERVITPIKMAALQVEDLTNWQGPPLARERNITLSSCLEFPGLPRLDHGSARAGISSESGAGWEPKEGVSHRYQPLCLLFNVWTGWLFWLVPP